MSVYGYARCSTDERRQDIDRQVRELLEAGAPKENIYLEYASGGDAGRLELARLLERVGPGDTVVTPEVSRLTRSTRHLCELIELFRARRARLVILGSVTIDCTAGEADPMTRAFLQIAGVFAELERNLASARVKSGLKNARAKGRFPGRPRLTPEQVPLPFRRAYPLYRQGKITLAGLARLAGVSRTSAYKYRALLDSNNVKHESVSMF